MRAEQSRRTVREREREREKCVWARTEQSRCTEREREREREVCAHASARARSRAREYRSVPVILRN